MKISKLKALTIATTVIGSASLASVAGVTAVAVLDNQTSDNQSYSQTGNSDNGQSNNVNGGGNISGDNSPNNGPNPDTLPNTDVNPNPDTPPSIDTNPNIGIVTESDIQKEFTTQKTTDASDKVFDALNQIKTIDDVWNFYPQPDNIPSNFSITLNNVTTTSQTPDGTLGLQVTVTINGNTPATFVIYGFSPYTDQDYKQIFEAANPSGKFTKDGKYFPYLDWNDLSKDSSNPNYFGNYFKPVIPVELSANNIIVTPDSFNLSPNNVVNYYYVLHSPDNKVSVKASVPVSAYYDYQYPDTTGAYKPVNKSWKPVNFDFIKANLPVNYSRTDFDSFILKHWNGSTLADAINAYRYWYLFDQSNITSKVKSYALNTKNYTSFPGKLQMGAIISGGAKDFNFNPTYDASMNLNGNKSALRLNWHYFIGANNFTRVSQVLWPHNWTPPYNIDAGLNIAFDSKKPDALNKDGLVSIPVTVTSDVILDNYEVKQFVYRNSHLVKTWNWTVLDALYYYFKNSSSLDKSYSTPFIYQYEETLHKLV